MWLWLCVCDYVYLLVYSSYYEVAMTIHHSIWHVSRYGYHLIGRCPSHWFIAIIIKIRILRKLRKFFTLKVTCPHTHAHMHTHTHTHTYPVGWTLIDVMTLLSTPITPICRGRWSNRHSCHRSTTPSTRTRVFDVLGWIITIS